MGGSIEQKNPKSLGPPFSLCRHAGIDAALAKPDFFFAGAPTIENKIEQKTQNTKVPSAKVAFDTLPRYGLSRRGQIASIQWMGWPELQRYASTLCTWLQSKQICLG